MMQEKTGPRGDRRGTSLDDVASQPAPATATPRAAIRPAAPLILKVLPRDSTLRLAYLRRRWQTGEAA